MITVLINAYAVCPNSGSEPGMAWNWIVNLAKHCNLHIITEGEWKNEIEKALEELPQKDNLHFYYNPVSGKIRQICWNQGDWRFYWYYRQWQKETLKIAKRICQVTHIDVLHQLNMIGFREPGYLWTIKHIPFVWGPIGGMQLMNPEYIKYESTGSRLFMSLKNLINDWQRKHHPRVLKAIDRASVLIAATSSVCDFMKSYHKKAVVFINETGCYERAILAQTKPESKELNLIWVGRFVRRKQLSLALHTISLLKDYPEIRLHVIGAGNPTEETLYKNMAENLGISHNVIWHGKIPHAEVQKQMSQTDIFFFPSIMEGTPHVVLEAIQNSLPVLCFDICGQGDVVNETVGVKIEITNPTQDAVKFAEIIKDINQDRAKLQLFSANCTKRQQELSWDAKARQMVDIYHSCLSSADQT